MKKILSVLLACMMLLAVAIPAFAAPVAEATIDMTRTGSIELFKYDFTNAEKDNVWHADSYVSTGVRDQAGVEAILGASNPNTNYYGNGYAISGVEFTYLRVADIRTYTEAESGNNKVMVLYGFDNTKSGGLLQAIGLTNADRYTNADFNTQHAKPGFSYFNSDVLVTAMRNALAADATAVKNALEAYVAAQGGVAFPLTDNDGHTKVTGLGLGLYLVVETKVPENVTNTVNPFFVSLPMTSVNGTNATDGGNRWMYDVTLYPKNETGIPTLEKLVREAKEDTGKNDATANIHDGFAHTGTGSEGDVMEYEILSTLPSITSDATALSVYTFVDTLSKGLEYNRNDVLIEFFTDAECTDKVASWNEASGKFTVVYGTSTNDATTMTIAMTANGLDEINHGTYAGALTQGATVRRGYSDLTMRITYAATINSNHDTVLGDAGNPNNVVLTWSRSNTNYIDTLNDDAHVYTYGIELTKLFEDKDGRYVDGDYAAVKFVMYNATDKYWVKATLNAEEGIYYVVDHTDEADANADTYETIFSPMAAEPNKGKIVIKGLEDDEYIITEIETADKYTLLQEDIKLVISVEETAADCTVYANQDYATLIHNLVQNDPRFAEVVGTKDEALILGWLNNVPQRQLAHKLLTASATVDGNAVTMLAEGTSVNAIAPLTVVNTIGFDLPKTGSTGTWLLSILGILGIGAATFVIIFAGKKRKSEQA